MVRSSVTRAALALVAVSALGATAAANPHLDRARTLEEGLEYAAALDELREAVVYGGNARDEMIAIYRLTGEVAGGLGDEETAYNAFRRLIAIEGVVALPPGTSPKIAGPYQRAADSLAGASIEVELDAAPGVVIATVTSDPVGMVGGARAVYVVGGMSTHSETDAADTMRLAVPDGATDVSVEIVDRHDNVLAVAVPARGAGPVHTPSDPAAARPTATPLYARWWLWGGVSFAAAATGVGFGLATRSAQDDLDAARADSQNVRYDQVESIISRGRRNALIANISFGVAGVAAAVAVWALFVRSDGAGVAVAPTDDGGVAVVAAGRF